MNRQRFYDALVASMPRAQWLWNEPMSRRTTFRVGGPADLMLVAQGEEEIANACAACQREGVECFVMGNGSILLVLDGGIPGVTVLVGQGMREITRAGNVLTAQAGASLNAVAQAAQRAGLAGLAFAAQIPGTLGGGTVMNAGAYGGELKDVITSVRLLEECSIRDMPAGRMDFSYRHSRVRAKGGVVLSVRLELSPGDPEAIRADMEEYGRRRREKQPLEYPSAGSTFKRPQGYFAGALVEQAGLRGFRIGGAQVSEKHCGFIINRGDATAGDIRALMAEVARRVYEHSGVTLEPEVCVVGRE